MNSTKENMETKNIYLILIVVIALVAMSIYTTYAVFTNEVVTTNTAVNIEVGLSYKFNTNEVQILTIPAGEQQVIEINATNASSSAINYKLYYELVSGDTKNLEAGYLEETANPVSGNLNASESKKITVGFVNNGSNDIIIKLGLSSADTLASSQNAFTNTITIVTGPLDTSGANAPVTVSGMIPVYYDETNDTWRKADETNTKKANQWYDYDKKMWANVVMVTSGTRSTYMNAAAGTEIPMDDILAFYVWIPRYKYTIFNQNYKTAAISPQEIGITFETGTATTGNVTCTTNNYGKQTCNNVVNGNTYTHPAFTYNGTQLPGVWIGKFEFSCEDSGYTYGYGDSDYECTNIRNKPSSITLANQVMPVKYKQAKLINSTNYISTADTIYSHLTKSIDFGATLYFMHSKYGRCTDGVCSIPAMNNCPSNIAGCANSNDANTYNTESGLDASSTGNIYGIYDLSSKSEIVTANNMRASTTSTTYNTNGAGTVWNYYPNDKPAAADYDVYYANSDKTSLTSSILGDATGETQGWYATYTWFSYTGSPLLIRQSGTNSFLTTFANDINIDYNRYRNIVIVK